MGSKNIYEATAIVQAKNKLVFVKVQVEKIERSGWIWGMLLIMDWI